MDFSVIIPKMRTAVQEYMTAKNAQGKALTEREATLRWLDKHYEEWLAEQIGFAEKETQLPDTRKDAEKRKHKRVPIEISAYYRVLWTPKSDAAAATATTEVARVRNISAGGLYIVTGRAYPVSTLMEIQFELPTVMESISAFSMVVWREECGTGRFGHGLHFSHIESHDVDLINEVLMERLLDAPVVNLATSR